MAEKRKELTKLLRAYILVEHIDFEERSKAYKGTVEWSEYVYDFLAERFPELFAPNT